MKIRLIANGSQPWERWVRRWGLAFLIDEDILFDAFGDARVLMGNLCRFKVDLTKIRWVVISHDHWDHVDGLRLFLMKRPGMDVNVPNRADAEVKAKIRLWGGNVVDVVGSVQIKEGVYSSGEIIGKYDGKDMPEQSLVLETGKGLVVVAGCAHPGIVTIVNHVRKIFRSPVHGVIGGFHLKDHSVEDIGIEATRLKAAGVDMVVPLHCTGARAEKVFKQVFGAGCLLIQEGQEITL
jgi:7,8-dihydropterin-6-yl-methyl-4-(beta-D-ribofuranosyl)aminobenzene 5'-phosphate synthase